MLIFILGLALSLGIYKLVEDSPSEVPAPHEITASNLIEASEGLEAFKSACNRYPTQAEWPRVFEKSLPEGCAQDTDVWPILVDTRDGWGKKLHYFIDEQDEAVVYSLGADGKLGGEGDAADQSEPELQAAEWEKVSASTP